MKLANKFLYCLNLCSKLIPLLYIYIYIYIYILFCFSSTRSTEKKERCNNNNNYRSVINKQHADIISGTTANARVGLDIVSLYHFKRAPFDSLDGPLTMDVGPLHVTIGMVRD